MKSTVMNPRSKSGSKTATTQKAIFELKQRVVLSLNKLADRDTYPIGVDELAKTAESLTSDMITPFLSCILDTDSEQKSAVRKECVTLMGTLARFHGNLLAPHLPKIIASIVKRLKDTDSVVRDACVETSGVLATSARRSGSVDSNGGSSSFVVLVRPLFEALGEQNRYMQLGAALCLAKIIDESTDPPQLILPQMLARVVKLLKNQHFMAKPAVIDLIRSIIQAGGRLAENGLSAAISAILEALKSHDWTTRKAASMALASIAISPGPPLASHKSLCICSLESCRFDKVKPVRDSIMHALHCWREMLVTGSPEPSEAGSSTKENFCGDHYDITSASENNRRDSSFRKKGPVSVLSGGSSSATSTQKKAPLAVKKACASVARNHLTEKSNHWHIEISVAKNSSMPPSDSNCNESSACITNDFERSSSNSVMLKDVKYDYDLINEKPEFSSESDLVSGSYETKHVTVSNCCLEENDSGHLIVRNQRPASSNIGQACALNQERNSLDSTITDQTSHSPNRCCANAANELAFIKQKLLDIETKQSSLLDLLKVLMGNSTENLSTLQMKVHNLEHAVDKITNSIMKQESSIGASKFLMKKQSFAKSPRLSALTPRSSTEDNYKQPSILSKNVREIWGAVAEQPQMWKEPTLNIIKEPIVNGTQNNSEESYNSWRSCQQRNAKDRNSVSASSRLSNLENMAGFWRQVNDLLNVGNLDEAYMEVLHSGDDHCLIKLMDSTGPILERLSSEISTELLNLMTTNFVDQGFLDSAIPWLQQVVDLYCEQQPRHLFLSSEAQTELILRLQEIAKREITGSAERMAISKIARKLKQVWAENPYRKTLAGRGQRVSKNPQLVDGLG